MIMRQSKFLRLMAVALMVAATVIVIAFQGTLVAMIAREGAILADLRLTRAQASLELVKHFVREGEKR
jgi:hypothetical protein